MFSIPKNLSFNALQQYDVHCVVVICCSRANPFPRQNHVRPALRQSAAQRGDFQAFWALRI